MTAAAVSETKTRVVLIDLSSIFYQAWHSSGGDAISMAKARTLDAIQRIASKGGLIAICCDLGKSFRKDLSPAYKANRPDKDQNMLGELERIRERLRADGYLLWEANGFEADDVIATATQQARANGHEVLIASADKDLLQLVGMGVRQLRTHTMKEGGAAEVMTDFGVGPSQFGDWLALVGDKSDNIPGAPGVGPKTATALLRAFTNLETLYTTLGARPAAVTDAIGRNAKAILDSLALSANAVELSRKLVELRTDVPIRWEEIYQERKPMPLTTFEEPREPGEDDGDAPTEAEIQATVPRAPEPTAAPAAPAAVVPSSPADSTVSIGELIKMPDKPAPTETRMATAPQPFDRQLEPMTLKEAFWLAQGMFESRLYAKFGSPHAIWAAMIRGREMGFPALASLDAFHVMDGKPCLTSNTIHVLAERLPDCEYLFCIEDGSDGKRATWETKHRKHPAPKKLSYTIEEAVTAGLCGMEIVQRTAPPNQKDSRGNWDKRRPNMLRKTARDNLIRMVFPSAAALYSAEELGADID